MSIVSSLETEKWRRPLKLLNTETVVEMSQVVLPYNTCNWTTSTPFWGISRASPAVLWPLQHGSAQPLEGSWTAAVWTAVITKPMPPLSLRHKKILDTHTHTCTLLIIESNIGTAQPFSLLRSKRCIWLANSGTAPEGAAETEYKKRN